MIGIVGGGMAGLAAAHRLQAAGRSVTVFEADDDVGGLAATYDTSGDPIEQFYHHLSKREETIVALADELGLGGAVEWRVGRNAYYVDGVVHPLDTPWQIAAFPSLSLYDKFRLGMLTLEIDVRGGVPRLDAYEDLEAFDDVPVEEFLREHTTRRVYEHFWSPLLDAKFGDRAGDVSAAWLLGRVKFRGERDLRRGEILGYVRGSFARLVDALVEDVGRDRIETGTRVTEIRVDDGQVAGATIETDTGKTRRDLDAVIVAAMPSVLESLCGYRCGIDFQGTVCAVVSLQDAVTDTYWLNIADDAPFGVLLEHTNFVPPERYGGEHLLYLASYVQDFDDPLWRMSDDEVRAHWLDGLESLFPDVDPDDVNWVCVARNPQTAPVYERGYLDDVVPYDLGDAVGDGVYYAGMASRAQYPERSLNGAIEAGFAAADALVDADP